MCANHKRNVFKRAQRGKDTGNLERTPQAKPGAIGRGKARNVAALKVNATRIGWHKTRQLPDQGGFPGTIGPDQGMNFTFFNRQ